MRPERAGGRGALDRRRFLRGAAAGLGVLGAGALLSACGGSASPGGGTAFGIETLQLSWIKNAEFLGQYVADARGYFREAGFEGIEMVAGGAASTATEANLVSGNCWVGISAPSLTAPAVAAGAPIKIVAATYQRNPYCITSSADRPIAEPREMIGKRIGVQDINDQSWNALLLANRIDPASITRVPVQFDPTPLVSGEVDGFVSYVMSAPSALTVRGFPNTSFLFADWGLPLAGETFTVLQETIDEERDKLKAFLRAITRGWSGALADVPAAVRLTVDEYGRDLNLDYDEQLIYGESQRPLIVSPETEANGLMTMSDDLIEANMRALSLSGVTVAPEQLFDPSLMREIHDAEPTLR